MDTIVTARVIAGMTAAEQAQAAIARALGWFGEVERVCSRFDPASEVFRLSGQPGVPVPASPLLFEAVQFALRVADLTDGVFDPTVGAAQAGRGFNRNYRTGERVAAPRAADIVSWRDLTLDRGRRTIELHKPLLLDLGAVAKGLAVDLAARELDCFDSFSIDAGGDLYVKGRNEQGQPWRIGIEHPRLPGLIATLEVPRGAICSSGDYARPAASEGEHHLLDPRMGRSPRDAIACTVVAPTTMLADALSTAALIGGPVEGLRFLSDGGVEGMIVSPSLSLSMTPGFERLMV